MIRLIRVGGISKQELRAQLEKLCVKINESGESLFAYEGFVTSTDRTLLETVEVSVADLGHRQGATIAQLYESAFKRELSLCPLELGPHLRLQFLDQVEGHLGHPSSLNRAPPGSVTVASQPISEDDDIPKGFYLRRIDGVLWLRGYRSGPEHVWSPEDRFIFCRSENTV